MTADAPEAEKDAVVGWRDLIAGDRLPRFALVALGIWLTAAEALMTATVMPSVAADVGGLAWFGWAVALFYTGSILAGATSGRLSTQYGLKRAMMLGGLVYVLGCVGCALAPSMALFLAGRLLQGVGGGWVVGLSFVAVSALFPQRLWSRVFSALAGVWGAATVLSPLVGGLFAQAGFWRGAFWLFAAQGLIFIAAAGVLIGAHTDSTPIEKVKEPISALIALTAGIIAIGAAGLVGSPALAAGLGLIACGLLALFLRLNAKAEAPLLPRQVSDVSSGVGAGLFVVFAFSAATASFGVYGPALFKTLYGASPVLAGYVLGVEAFAWTTAALLTAGRTRVSVYLRLGSSLIVLGVVLLALVVPHAGLIWAAVASITLGAGFGCMWAFTSARIVANAPLDQRAIASAATPTTQMIGGAVGAAAAGVIANLSGFGAGLTIDSARRAGFWLFAAFIPLALAGGAAAWRLASPRFAEDRDTVNDQLTEVIDT